ncbi:MAG: hypothetical protein HC875_29340 [Anaerolineales bacterium]|nr:hypothetical protein [Anaerolineales bacterium]
MNLENLAIYSQKYGPSWLFYLYDYRKLASNYLEGEAGWEKVVVGMINFGPSHNLSKETPCFSASSKSIVYEVHRVVAQNKLGPLLYDLALVFASKAGGVGLMADRAIVRPEAQRIYNAWFKSKKGATGIDVIALKMDRPPPENKTIPTIDDCDLHDETEFDPSVNYVYRTTSNNSILEDLIKNHQKVIELVSKETLIKKGEIEAEIADEGESLWKSNFNEEEEYQRKIKKGYEKKKKQLIGLGGNRDSGYYQIKKAFYRRSKSAPDGY